MNTYQDGPETSLEMGVVTPRSMIVTLVIHFFKAISRGFPASIYNW